MVREELARMPPRQQEAFLEEYERRRTRIPVAYLAWLVFSHNAYLGGRWIVPIFFWLTAGNFLTWWLVDAFRIPWMVNALSRDIAVEVLRDMRFIAKP